MDILWSPWRSEYIDTFKNEKENKNNKTFFMNAIENPEQDIKNLVVKRFENCFVILNKFPYNNGHLLIAPYREISDIEELTDDELFEIMQTIKKCVRALKIVYNPHGFNIGCNLGRVAGAGVPQHIHYHIVPRWNGDANFMSVTGNAKVVSESLAVTRDKLSKALTEIM
jgi:ATP adenylyltransferase